MGSQGVLGVLERHLRVVLLTTGALFLSLILEPLIEPDFSPLFLGAIALCTWRWGVRAGGQATFLSALALLYLFLPPHYTLTIPSWDLLVRELAFLGTASLIIWLVKRFTAAQRSLVGSLEEIRAREERFRVALLKSPVVVFHQDTNLRYTWVYNPLPEHRGDSFASKTDFDLFPHEDAERLTRIKRAVLSTGLGSRHEVAITLAGNTHTMDLTLEPFRDTAGKLMGVLGTAVDVTERKAVEDQLRHSREQLRGLAARIQSMLEAERTEISRDIHDHISQMLAALDLQLAMVTGTLAEGADPAAVAERMKSISAIVGTTIERSQKISTELRPSLLDNLGLAAAIEWQAQEFESRTGIPVTMLPLKQAPLPQHVSTAVFRIFQETLSNIEKHAQASEVQVSLRPANHSLVLQVRDDGRGITNQEIADSRSLGLLGMQEQVRSFGGKVSVQGFPGKGTKVCVGIPLAWDPTAGESLLSQTMAKAGCSVTEDDSSAAGAEILCPMDGSPCSPTRTLPA